MTVQEEVRRKENKMIGKKQEENKEREGKSKLMTRRSEEKGKKMIGKKQKRKIRKGKGRE